MQYTDLYRQSIQDKEVFWANEAAKLSWTHKPGKILSKDEYGHYKWFADGKPYAIPSTIDGPLILKEVKEVLTLRKLGIAFQ